MEVELPCDNSAARPQLWSRRGSSWLAESLHKFEVAFVQAAVQLPALQGEIQASQALIQSSILHEILEEIRGWKGLEAATRQNVQALFGAGPQPGSLRVLPEPDCREDAPSAACRDRSSVGAGDRPGREVQLAPVFTLLTHLLEKQPTSLENAELMREKGRASLRLEVLNRHRIRARARAPS